MIIVNSFGHMNISYCDSGTVSPQALYHADSDYVPET